MGMGFPAEWELDLHKDGNENGNTTAREWERLMLVVLALGIFFR